MNAETAVLHRLDQSMFNVAEEMDKVVGDLSQVEVCAQQVLVGVYVRPQVSTIKGANGELIPFFSGGTGQAAMEDIYQGKVARVLKLGPQAFPKSTLAEWGEAGPPKVGDWIAVDAGAGIQVSLKCRGSQDTGMFEGIKKVSNKTGWPCRFVQFADIFARVTEPQVMV
jgi:hypothetical protein